MRNIVASGIDEFDYLYVLVYLLIPMKIRSTLIQAKDMPWTFDTNRQICSFHAWFILGAEKGLVSWLFASKSLRKYVKPIRLLEPVTSEQETTWNDPEFKCSAYGKYTFDNGADTTKDGSRASKIAKNAKTQSWRGDTKALI
ncbi:hypothetical protein C5167_006554 [Papaver somniferum]|uniref:Uncharacterized protein n=1 Tax=Papaver somniferum TaxID=3469 RepID=A0A4Y7JH43_PAPSO|nr:hypothetical protein C5167_006554 [Papaver somniferum]